MPSETTNLEMNIASNSQQYPMSYGRALGNNDTPIPSHKLITAIHERNGQIDSVDTETIDSANVSYTTTHVPADIGTNLADVFDLSRLVSAHTAVAGIDAAASIGGEAKILANTANAGLTNKVDKVTGKGLSTNDFTTAHKDKLDAMTTPVNAISVSGGSLPVISMTYKDSNNVTQTAQFYNKLAVDALFESLPLVVTYTIDFNDTVTCSMDYDDIIDEIGNRGVICIINHDSSDNTYVGATVRVNTAQDTIESQVIVNTNLTVNGYLTTEMLTVTHSYGDVMSASLETYRTSVDSHTI